jgi:putative peptidoglycan lipid II flippase
LIPDQVIPNRVRADQAEGLRDTSGSMTTLAAGWRALALWTVVSRFSGFMRVAVLAAILGPTFFGNLFQTALLVPLAISELMAGTMMPAVLAPRLVQALDRRDKASVDRITRGFLGILLLALVLITVLGMLLAPLLLAVLTSAVEDAGIRARQTELGWPLLIVMLPQVVLYGLIGVSVAVQHAHQRFAFATAAPILESLGLAAVLGVSAAIFGASVDVETITLEHVLLLGVGSTLAVALHACIQVGAVLRLGVRLVPSLSWKDADVRQVFRISLQCSGSAGLTSLGRLGLLIAAGQIPGAALALQVGVALFNLPVALCARPIGAAQLPELARAFGAGRLVQFRSVYRQTLQLALFIALPASLLFLAVPENLAAAVSFGRMDDPAAISMIAAALAGLSIGIIGEAVIVLSVSAAHARLDAKSPVIAAAIRVVVLLVGVLFATSAQEAGAVLFMLGGAWSTGACLGAVFIHLRAVRGLPTPEASPPWLPMNLAIAVLSVVPSAAIAMWIEPTTESPIGRLLVAGALTLVGVSIYMLFQLARRSPEAFRLIGFIGIRWPTRMREAQ